MTDRPIGVLLVDDSPEFLSGVAGFFETLPGLRLVQTTTSALASLALARQNGVDVVLVDLQMPEMNGLEVVRWIKTGGPLPRVVMLTLHDEPEYREAARAAGADAFVSKRTMARDLVPVLNALFDQAAPGL